MINCKMVTADFSENTITVQTNEEFAIVAGDYVLMRKADYEQKLYINDVIEHRYRVLKDKLMSGENYDHILEAIKNENI